MGSHQVLLAARGKFWEIIAFIKILKYQLDDSGLIIRQFDTTFLVFLVRLIRRHNGPHAYATTKHV